MSNQGSEWEAWSGGGSGDEWKPSQNVGALVVLRFKSYKELDTRFGEWKFIETDVTMVTPDGTKVEEFSDVAISGAWFVATFKDHLPYRALGCVESFTTDKGTGYKLRTLTDDELKVVTEAADLPGF